MSLVGLRLGRSKIDVVEDYKNLVRGSRKNYHFCLGRFFISLIQWIGFTSSVQQSGSSSGLFKFYNHILSWFLNSKSAQGWSVRKLITYFFHNTFLESGMRVVRDFWRIYFLMLEVRGGMEMEKNLIWVEASWVELCWVGRTGRAGRAGRGLQKILCVVLAKIIIFAWAMFFISRLRRMIASGAWVHQVGRSNFIITLFSDFTLCGRMSFNEHLLWRLEWRGEGKKSSKKLTMELSGDEWR